MSVGIALSKEVEEHLIEVSRKKEILISREKKMPYFFFFFLPFLL